MEYDTKELVELQEQFLFTLACKNQVSALRALSELNGTRSLACDMESTAFKLHPLFQINAVRNLKEF